MQISLPGRLLAGVLVASLMLAGCSAGTKSNGASTDPVVAQNEGKPTLVVPTAFVDTTAKQQFAIKAVNEGYYSEAKPLLEELAATSTDAVVHTKLGTASYATDDLDAALASWTKAAELNPELTAEMQNNIGNVLRDKKQPEHAEQAYRKALEIDPTVWTAAVNLASLLKEENRLPEAIEVLQAAAAVNTEVPTLVSLLESFEKDSEQG